MSATKPMPLVRLVNGTLLLAAEMNRLPFTCGLTCSWPVVSVMVMVLKLSVGDGKAADPVSVLPVVAVPLLLVPVVEVLVPVVEVLVPVAEVLVPVAEVLVAAVKIGVGNRLTISKWPRFLLGRAALSKLQPLFAFGPETPPDATAKG